MSTFNYSKNILNIANSILNDKYLLSEESEQTQSEQTTNESSEQDEIKPIAFDDLKNIMKINYSYPDHADPHFQSKIYKKREFYYHKIPAREILTEYADIKKFRDMACGGNFRLRSQQSLLSNFINPETPFRGLLIYHGTGTGKCVHPSTSILINDSLSL